MSSLAGEQALKDGLSFEFTWAARHLIEVMDEHAEAITLGGQPSEAGVDFRLHFADREEHHQIKRASSSNPTWTLATLDSENVLRDFRDRLTNPAVHCHFISGIHAIQLRHLGDRARRSNSFSEFVASYLTGDHVAWFRDLASRWGLPSEECWLRLRRVHARTFDETELTSHSHILLRHLVRNCAEDTWLHLREYCLTHAHQRATSAHIWQWLTQQGVRRHIIDNDPRLVSRIQAQTKQYLDGIRSQLIQPPLPRQLSVTVVKSLAESDGAEDIVLLGAPGGGKSALMFQIAEACQQKGWPILAFRLDDLPATLTVRQLQEHLDLPVPPADAIARASAGTPALVIIDQLDAVSEYSGRTGSLLDRIASFIDELRAFRLKNPIHLVLACREVDWRHDGRLRRLHPPIRGNEEKEANTAADPRIHTVPNLEDAEITKILCSIGLSLTQFSPRQREQLLRRPQYLALLVEARPDPTSLPRLISPKHLFDIYWDKKKNLLDRDFPAPGGSHWHTILKHITDKLADTALSVAAADDDRAPLAITLSSLDGFSSPSIRWLISNGVLAEGARRIRFGHESFFDYCFARFFKERDQTLLQYLLQSDQTLLQRGQVRQVLAYQRDEEPETYIATLRQLLNSTQVRPHLLRLIATVICEVPDPREDEWHLIATLIPEALGHFDSGAPVGKAMAATLVFEAFHASQALFMLACQKGALAKWLETSGKQSTARLFRVIATHQGKVQQRVWTLIEPLIGNKRYDTDLDELAHFCSASDSRPTFDWMMDVMLRAREGDKNNSAWWDKFFSLTADLAHNRPDWLAEWLAAVIQANAEIEPNNSREILHPGEIETNKLQSAGEKAPRAFLVHVLPAMFCAIRRLGHGISWIDEEGHESDDELHSVFSDEPLFEAMVHALGQMFHLDYPYAAHCLRQLLNSDLYAMRRLGAVVLCHDTQVCTPIVADYLSGGGRAFSVDLKRLPAACQMLKNHAHRFSEAELSAIEKAIFQYWPKHQNGLRKDHEEPSARLCLGNWRGYTQMELLSAFPLDRLSPHGKKRLAEWKRKFVSMSAFDEPSRRTSRLNKEVLIKWAPGRFLHAITARQTRVPRSRRLWEDRDESIAAILREAVAQRPAEFIHALQQCNANTSHPFISGIDTGLMNLDLDSELALLAAKEFHRLGSAWSWRTINLLKKVKPGKGFKEAFQLAMDYARNGSGVGPRQAAEEGKLGQRLHLMANDCPRGQAIEVLRHMLWAEPEILGDLKPYLPAMMRDPCPAIRAEMASLCYAVACKAENLLFATQLFFQLVHDQLPDEHVLTSHWPWKYMRSGLVHEWNAIKPILVRMQTSTSSEVRSTASNLICLALISGQPAQEMATTCATSTDSRVRVACASVLSYNVDVEAAWPWSLETLLILANDPDREVRQAAGIRQHRKRRIDFGPLSEFLRRYVKTRAFILGSGHFLDALEESHALLPTIMVDILELFISRLHEPVEDVSERISIHTKPITSLLIRLYNENRDAPLRKRLLDLIDRLCVEGSLTHHELDQ